MLLITLESARRNAGLTMKEAADLAGIHYQTLRKYEIDSSNIPLSLLSTLSTVYQVPKDNIFLGIKYDLIRTIKIKRVDAMSK